MFANATLKVDISQRVVATLVASAMLLASIGYHSIVQAANFEFITDTVSDSAPSALPSHRIEFTVPTGSSIGPTDSITINFEGFSTVNNVVLGDITATVNGGAVTEGGFSQSLTQFSFNGVTATGGDDIVVVVAAGNITNPVGIGSYEVQITTPSDYGETEVAIVDTVEVTASVDTTFTFTVTGTATNTPVHADLATGSTTPVSINFGQLVADTPEILAQELAVETNAKNGYTVTVESDGDLQSANGAIIDTFTDGTDIAVAGTAWTAPGDQVLDPLTWGHWGVTSDDSDLANSMTALDSYIAASTSAREIMSHDGPADGTTQDVGFATIGYQVEITPLQEAADDYNTTLTYIATPTF